MIPSFTITWHSPSTHPSSKAKQETINSLLDAYLTQCAAFHANGAASSAASKKASGQAGEDTDEVEKASMGGTAKKLKRDPLPGPSSVEKAQEHAMQQSSHFASGFSSIAESFKPDTPEVFESKAKAIAMHIGIVQYHIRPSVIMCLIYF